MLDVFDWLCRCQTGVELLAALRYFEKGPDLPGGEAFGPPHAALGGPCQRCWIYPRAPRRVREASNRASLGLYCEVCQAILDGVWQMRHPARHAVIVWGAVNRLPQHLETRQGFYQEGLLSAYIRDEHHFLLMLFKRQLRDWLQELVLYHGADLTGLIQIFPPSGRASQDSMGDVLASVISQEIHSVPDQLRVRFYAAPYQVLAPHLRERQRILTFEVAEFMRLLDAAAVFRVILPPDQQQAVHEILTLEDAKEAGFYWGRFIGQIGQEARDMLEAWRIRAWPKERVQLLYELLHYNYVDFSQTP